MKYLDLKDKLQSNMTEEADSTLSRRSSRAYCLITTKSESKRFFVAKGLNIILKTTHIVHTRDCT